MGDRQYPPRYSLRSQTHPSASGQRKREVAAQILRGHARSNPLRMVSLEEEGLSLIPSGAAPFLSSSRLPPESALGVYGFLPIALLPCCEDTHRNSLPRTQ